MSAATTQTHESHYTDGVRADETSLPRFNGDWETKQIGELIHLIPSGIYGLETQTGQLIGMPVSTTAHIDLNDRWNEKQGDIRYFTEQQIAHYSPLEGDLIVVKSSGSAASIQSGKIGYVSADKVGSFVFSNFLMLLRPVGCNAQFLFFQLVSSRVKQMLPHLVEASTYPNIRINDYLEIQIPLPPEEEQVAIVSVLSDVDGLLGALDALIAKKRAIKQAAMQQLLTGKTRLPGFNGGWKMKQLGELIHLIPSGIYGLETQTGQLIGMPVVTTAHIDLNDRWNEKQMNIRYFTEGQIEHYSPLEGDLIVVKSSGSAASIQSGKIGYVSAGKTQSFVFSNFLMLLRPIGCNAQFLFFQLTSGRVKQMLPQLVEASTYPNLRINDYLEVQIPLPPEEEQLAIVNVLSDMDTGIAALERRRDKTRAIKQGMMQQLLTGRVRLVKSDAGA